MTTCGDRVVEGSEQCDDGNLDAGDCCDACQAETGCEVERNDTVQDANAFATFAMDDSIDANIDPTGDVDLYVFTVPAGGERPVRIATDGGRSGGTCEGAVDTIIQLYDVGGQELARNDDIRLDGSFCSRIEATLQPGTYLVGVAASSTGFSDHFDYSLQVVVDAPLLSGCGDGVLALGEGCDDSNVDDGDGCSTACLLECPGGFEAEPNDDVTSATTIVAGAPSCGDIKPAPEVDFWTFTLTGPSTAITLAADRDIGVGCGGVGELHLVAPDGSELVGAAYEPDGCHLAMSSRDPGSALRFLPPGTYHARIRSLNGGERFSYRLSLTLDSICGDGVVEGAEQCDGGSSCNTDCTHIALCGDGAVADAETCDDGNVVDGDGCSSTCQVDGVVGEVEANDTQTDADTNGLVVDGDALISGSLHEGSDEVDVFRIDLAQQTVLRLETFTSITSDCAADRFLALRVRDASFNQLHADLETKGIRGCSALVVSLPAGTFYLSVEERGQDDTVPRYLLQVAVQDFAGTESESPGMSGLNNDAMTAETTIQFVSDVYVLGDHTAGSPGGPGITDRDFYALDVPAGASVRAEVIEGDTDPNKTCESNNLDSEITLWGSTGFVQLANDDDDGRGFCSLIDGTGAMNVDGGAHNLPGGVYFLEVRESDAASGTDDVFVYRLVVTLRVP